MVYTAFMGYYILYKIHWIGPLLGTICTKLSVCPFQLNLSWSKEIHNYIWTAGKLMSQISVSAYFTHLSSLQTRLSMIQQKIPIHFGVQTHEGNCPWIHHDTTQPWQQTGIPDAFRAVEHLKLHVLHTLHLSSSAFFFGFQKGFFKCWRICSGLC